MQTQLNERRPTDSISVEPTDDHQKERTGIDRVGKPNQKSMARDFKDCI